MAGIDHQAQDFYSSAHLLCYWRVAGMLKLQLLWIIYWRLSHSKGVWLWELRFARIQRAFESDAAAKLFESSEERPRVQWIRQQSFVGCGRCNGLLANLSRTTPLQLLDLWTIRRQLPATIHRRRFNCKHFSADIARFLRLLHTWSVRFVNLRACDMNRENYRFHFTQCMAAVTLTRSTWYFNSRGKKRI